MAELESAPSLLAPGPVLLLQFTAIVQTASGPLGTFERIRRRCPILLTGGSWLDFSLTDSLDHVPSFRAQPRDHMWYDLLPTLPAARMRHTFTGLFHGGVCGGCELASLILQMFPWIFCLGCFALSIWVTASFPTLTPPPTCSKPVHQNQ